MSAFANKAEHSYGDKAEMVLTAVGTFHSVIFLFPRVLPSFPVLS